MNLRIACFAVSLTAAGALPVAAQEFNDPNSFGVNANFSIQMPLDNKAQTADMAKAIAQLSTQLGDLANRECDVLSEAFKAECHVTQINIGTNVNERRNRRFNGAGGDGEQQKVVNANVQATFTLTPNAAAPKPAPTSTP
jgi:hypothetical protein